MTTTDDKWLKAKGYLHITPQINLRESKDDLKNKITDKEFVCKYNFFPLIHSSLRERKFKKIPHTNHRAHSYTDNNGKNKSFVKVRPLHYDTHLD